MSGKTVLPDAVKQLPLAERIECLRRLAPQRVAGLELLVDAALEEVWQQEFFAGPRGGLRRKGVPFVKGGA